MSMVEILFKKLVGGMGMSPTIFYNMTYKEARLALEGYKDEVEQNYYYNYYAFFNAIGQLIGGKKFKPMDPFKDDNKKSDKHRITKKEKQDIKKMFEQYENKVM